ncbi:sigma-70 family RNA polymerase sigma factor [Pseudonocardia sp. GCM10023141]|uniref:sigma-70 family RNA polymerase sigma factor n=1 Tax=Pseudonocardia sp. GCM10023141 TaxID=3252653 RepID=UPI00361E558A
MNDQETVSTLPPPAALHMMSSNSMGVNVDRQRATTDAAGHGAVGTSYLLAVPDHRRAPHDGAAGHRGMIGSPPEEVAICMGDGPAPERSEQQDLLDTEWETHRPAVFGVAYRLLGGVADAEDVTQDVWLRAAGADLRRVDDLRAWLITVAARRSYDILKSARSRRETYVGPWLPEPLLTGPDASEPVLVDESISSALLLVMQELGPPERVAFVLHDVFGFEFGRIAEVLDVSVPNARQLASRARRRVVAAKQSAPQAPKAERERVLMTFRAAYEAGDLAGLVRLLHPAAVYVTDGGDKAFAARKLIHGGQRVAEVMVRVGVSGVRTTSSSSRSGASSPWCSAGRAASTPSTRCRSPAV